MIDDGVQEFYEVGPDKQLLLASLHLGHIRFLWILSGRDVLA